MKLVLLAVAMSLATSASADIRDEIYYTAQDIQERVYQSDASPSELREAERLLLQASQLLRSGGGTSDSQAQFVCDASQYLKVSLVSNAGTTANISFYVGDAGLCQQQATDLANHHREIFDYAIFGVCDQSGYHQTYRLQGAGTIDRLQRRFLGSAASCAQQAAAINQQTSGRFEGTTAQFLCDSSGYLNIDAYGRSGEVATLRLFLGDEASCRQQSETMIDSHTRVADFDVIAICPSNSYLHRISLKHPTSVEALDRLFLGSQAECLAQAAPINAGQISYNHDGIAHFLCDSGGYLQMSVMNRLGATNNAREFLGSSTSCRQQADQLVTSKMFFETSQLVAICDGTGYLYKYMFRNDATVENLSRDYIGDYAACMRQADGIN